MNEIMNLFTYAATLLKDPLLDHSCLQVFLSRCLLRGHQLALRRTASAIASIPAAALTAFARDEDCRRALQAGFQVHLTKPIDPHSLVTAVANLGKLKAA